MNSLSCLWIVIEASLRVAFLYFFFNTIVITWYLGSPCSFKGDKYLKAIWHKKYLWIAAIIAVFALLFAFINNDGDCKAFFMGMVIPLMYNTYIMPNTLDILLQKAKGATHLDKKFLRHEAKQSFFTQIWEREGMDTLQWFIIRMILIALGSELVMLICIAIGNWFVPK